MIALLSALLIAVVLTVINYYTYHLFPYNAIVEILLAYFIASLRK